MEINVIENGACINFSFIQEKQVYKYITLLYFVVSGTVSIFTEQNDKIRTMIY